MPQLIQYHITQETLASVYFLEGWDKTLSPDLKTMLTETEFMQSVALIAGEKREAFTNICIIESVKFVPGNPPRYAVQLRFPNADQIPLTLEELTKALPHRKGAKKPKDAALPGNIHLAEKKDEEKKEEASTDFDLREACELCNFTFEQYQAFLLLLNTRYGDIKKQWEPIREKFRTLGQNIHNVELPDEKDFPETHAWAKEELEEIKALHQSAIPLLEKTVAFIKRTQFDELLYLREIHARYTAIRQAGDASYGNPIEGAIRCANGLFIVLKQIAQQYAHDRGVKQAADIQTFNTLFAGVASLQRKKVTYYEQQQTAETFINDFVTNKVPLILDILKKGEPPELKDFLLDKLRKSDDFKVYCTLTEAGYFVGDFDINTDRLRYLMEKIKPVKKANIKKPHETIIAEKIEAVTATIKRFNQDIAQLEKTIQERLSAVQRQLPEKIAAEQRKKEETLKTQKEKEFIAAYAKPIIENIKRNISLALSTQETQKYTSALIAFLSKIDQINPAEMQVATLIQLRGEIGTLIPKAPEAKAAAPDLESLPLSEKIIERLHQAMQGDDLFKIQANIVAVTAQNAAEAENAIKQKSVREGEITADSHWTYIFNEAQKVIKQLIDLNKEELAQIPDDNAFRKTLAKSAPKEDKEEALRNLQQRRAALLQENEKYNGYLASFTAGTFEPKHETLVALKKDLQKFAPPSLEKVKQAKQLKPILALAYALNQLPDNADYERHPAIYSRLLETLPPAPKEEKKGEAKEEHKDLKTMRLVASSIYDAFNSDIQWEKGFTLFRSKTLPKKILALKTIWEEKRNLAKDNPELLIKYLADAIVPRLEDSKKDKKKELSLLQKIAALEKVENPENNFCLNILRTYQTLLYVNTLLRTKPVSAESKERAAELIDSLHAFWDAGSVTSNKLPAPDVRVVVEAPNPREAGGGAAAPQQ